MRFYLLTLLLASFTLSQVNPIKEGKKLVENLTYENFEVTVQKGVHQPYFILFKMDNCGHCKRFEPLFYKIAFNMRKEPVKFGITNVSNDSK